MKIEASKTKKDVADITISGDEMARMISTVEGMNHVLNNFTLNEDLNTKITYASFYLANLARWFSQNMKKDNKPILSEDEWTDLFAAQAKSFLHQLP